MGAISVGMVCPAMLPAQEESYAVYEASPRLLLSEDRLRLMRREVERRTERWVQLELLIQGGAQFPEPAFAFAVGYLASQDKSLARKALEAISNDTDLRQMAMVRDWCFDALSDAERQSLNQRLRSGMESATLDSADPARARDITLAAVALADDQPEASAAALRRVHQSWWAKQVERIRAGEIPIHHDAALPFVELVYSFLRGLQLDLRQDVVRFFREYPIWHLLRHYPPSFAGGENDYRVPAYSGSAEPDIDDSIRARAAELAMVALDTNADESQYLQGWLINPRFRMRSAYGAPYEFFWCNPYQPSLSYFYLPLYQHLPAYGSLLARSSWEENATWFGLVDGSMQYFAEDGIRLVQRDAKTRLLRVGPSSIVLQGTASGGEDCYMEVPECDRLFWLGLAPDAVYEVEIDSEELAEARSSPGGVLELDLSNRPAAGVLIRKRGV